MATFRYHDRMLRGASRLTAGAALLGVFIVALTLVGVVDGSVVTLAILTAFLGFVAFFYRSAIAVEIEVGPDGISKRQGLGLGWQLDWASVTQLVVVDLAEPRLAVVSPELSRRRGLSEWPLRASRLPRTSRSMPATSEIVDAVAAHSPRPIEPAPAR